MSIPLKNALARDTHPSALHLPNADIPILPHNFYNCLNVISQLHLTTLQQPVSHSQTSQHHTNAKMFGAPPPPSQAELERAEIEGSSGGGLVRVTLNGKAHRPSPLVFYAAVLNDAPQPKLASRFVAWLRGPEARQILARYHYDDPGDAKPLVP